MRHATVWAIQRVLGIDPGDGDFPADHSACDWMDATAPSGRLENQWPVDEASKLIGRISGVARMPTCPQCAALVDMALLLRAEAEQAKYDAEREAEKRGAA